MQTYYLMYFMYYLMYFNKCIQLPNNWDSSFRIHPSIQKFPKSKGSQHPFPLVVKPTFDLSVPQFLSLKLCLFQKHQTHGVMCYGDFFLRILLRVMDLGFTNRAKYGQALHSYFQLYTIVWLYLIFLDLFGSYWSLIISEYQCADLFVDVHFLLLGQAHSNDITCLHGICLVSYEVDRLLLKWLNHFTQLLALQNYSNYSMFSKLSIINLYYGHVSSMAYGDITLALISTFPMVYNASYAIIYQPFICLLDKHLLNLPLF